MFKKKLGICGVLFPNGEFEECEYGKHHIILMRLDSIDKSLKYSTVCLSSKRNEYSSMGGNIVSGGSMLFEKDMGITKEQLEWLENHKEFMDKDQQFIFNTYKEIGIKIRNL